MNRLWGVVIRVLEWLARWSRTLRTFMVQERSQRKHLGIRTRPGMYLRGYGSGLAGLYQVDKYPLALYISNIEWFRSGFANGESNYVLKNKLIFQRVYAVHLEVPAVLAICDRGQILVPGNGRFVQSLRQLMQTTPLGVVGKPIDGSRGQGIFVIRRSDTDTVVCNGTTMEIEAAERLLIQRDGTIIVELVEQHPSTASLYQDTTNTLRVLTMIDPDTREGFIARAVQRIGVRSSCPVDNFSRGGISAVIDLETGRLGAGISKSAMSQTVPVWHSRHPESNTVIEGAHVPNWSMIRDELVDAAMCYPMTPYIGWDVIPTQSGYSVIEGNGRSDVDLLQVHGGLLVDERVRRFYLHHGVISRRKARAAERLSAGVPVVVAGETTSAVQ